MAYVMRNTVPLHRYSLDTNHVAVILRNSLTIHVNRGFWELFGFHHKSKSKAKTSEEQPKRHSEDEDERWQSLGRVTWPC